MQDLLKSLYRIYCGRKGQYDLPQEAEDAFQSLVKSLSSKADKHLLLIVEDAHNMVAEQVAEQSFICGFRLAAALSMEILTPTTTVILVH